MFRKKEKSPKEKKVRTMKIGVHRKTVIILWILLIASVSFGIYKNFTAIDMHTVHEKKIIQLQLNDTNGISNFVKNFAVSYHTWDNRRESLERRTVSINRYLTEELQELNVDAVRSDIPTSSKVNEVLIWDIEPSELGEYMVTYEVNQTVKENRKKKTVKEAYTVCVHVDLNKNMVIVQNPTLAAIPGKSGYSPKQVESNGSVNADTTQSVTSFLETFFKLYPSASEKELSYYVKGAALKPLNKGNDYLFAELVNPIYLKENNKIRVKVSVKYLDKRTKAAQISQFSLLLEKNGENWFVVK